jgi:hypothetical protein
MHAAFADDAVQIVKQTVKRRSSFLGMNAPVRPLSGRLHVALAPGMNADVIGDIAVKPWTRRPATPWARAASRGEPPALRVKNST